MHRQSRILRPGRKPNRFRKVWRLCPNRSAVQAIGSGLAITAIAAVIDVVGDASACAGAFATGVANIAIAAFGGTDGRTAVAGQAIATRLVPTPAPAIDGVARHTSATIGAFVATVAAVTAAALGMAGADAPLTVAGTAPAVGTAISPTAAIALTGRAIEMIAAIGDR